MEEKVITSIEQFIEADNFLEEATIFRGVSNVDHKLVPSIGRLDLNESRMYQFEQDILNDFKRKLPPFTKSVPSNKFDLLFLAQHHGLPTRLLDWTYNPLVSLFFAVENNHKRDACVYQAVANPIITPDLFYTWGNDPFKVNRIMGLIPDLTHVRFQNQNGLFTIHPFPKEEDLSKVITKWIIPYEGGIKDRIRWKLRKIGILKSLVFPSLDSLCYDIIEMHKVKYVMK